MPNIMITSRCNLSCNYCFANKLVNQPDASDITLDNFKTAISFLTSCGPIKMGLIGGEPTLHHQFYDILQIIIDNPLIERATLYTNGIELAPYISQLNNSKFRILFNCNTTPNISELQYQKMLSNIDKYYSNLDNYGSLGINIYNNEISCDYIFKLAKKYEIPVRISLTIPNIDICNSQTYWQYWNSRKDKLIEVIKQAKQNNIFLLYDCDFPPSCEILKEEILKNNINIPSQTCAPIIDITQNLEAVRCFGTSHLCKVKINDFDTLADLYNYFIEVIDKKAIQIITNEQCNNCNKQNKLECFGGCIRFKTKQLLEKGVK